MRPTLLYPVIPGLMLSFLAVLTGTGAGMAFGLVEDEVKDYFLQKAQTHVNAAYGVSADPTKLAKDAWRYVQRGHVHAQGLGALGIGIILVLTITRASPKVKTLLSTGIGLGAVLYPFCWFLAGFRIPSVGKEAAKASVDWLAAISIPLFFGGMCLVLAMLCLTWLAARQTGPGDSI